MIGVSDVGESMMGEIDGVGRLYGVQCVIPGEEEVEVDAFWLDVIDGLGLV